MNPESSISWRCRGRQVLLGERALIMGILNCTPDSFSDGGRYFEPALAVERAFQMAEEGADILDVGGESSRPGADPVSAEEELRRILPVLESLQGKTSCLISVDTTKAQVAQAAMEAGVHILNDISALTLDPGMLAVALASGAGLILMHMKGTPRTMQACPEYGQVVQEVRDYLAGRMKSLKEAGVEPECLAVDPGIGFGKTLEHNLALIAQTPVLKALGRPVVLGLSRKSFLGRLTGRETGDRLAAGLGAAAYALLRGADILRVHDVKESCDLARVVAMLRHEEYCHGVHVQHTVAGAGRIS